MSWDYNPFNHIELVRVEASNPADDAWIWVCHNCGGEKRDGSSTDLEVLDRSWQEHIVQSHRTSRSQVAGWPDR